MFRARIRDCMMCKQSVRTQFIYFSTFAGASVHDAACLLGLRENLVGSDDDVLSLMVNNI